MKKTNILILLFVLTCGFLSFGQTDDPLVSKCAMNAGTNAKYLKDFRVQLGKSSTPGVLRFKANVSLWKNTRYRFSMCNSEDSKGQLILNIRDESDRIILSSYDKNNDKIYPFVDFVCNKSGIYQLYYDFTDGQQGSGVGVVSMIK
jgi:hypothetical protein